MTPTWSRALVTGSSSGIGRAMACQLAYAGTDLVLVARDEDRLQELAGEVRQRHGVTAEVVVADLAEPGQRRQVEDRLVADPAVDLLVNNAGFGTYGRFWELEADGEEAQVAVNVTAVVRLTRAALPGMVQRGGGTVLNVASMAGLQPTPRNATYGATKAFVTNFSESLHEELRGTAVKVTVLCPGFTRTEFQERAGLGSSAGLPEVVWQSAEDCAAEGLAAAAAGRAMVVPGVLNKATVAVSGPLPRGVKRRVVSLLSTRFKD